jgi:hypothetical protein
MRSQYRIDSGCRWSLVLLREWQRSRKADHRRVLITPAAVDAIIVRNIVECTIVPWCGGDEAVQRASEPGQTISESWQKRSDEINRSSHHGGNGTANHALSRRATDLHAQIQLL